MKEQKNFFPREKRNTLMHFLKHVVSLIKEIFQFAWQYKVWWIVPVLFISLGIGFLIVAGETSAPFIYTLF